ncbi:MAG: ABC transporter ATP-binding protein [Sphingomonadaceae bacterium]
MSAPILAAHGLAIEGRLAATDLSVEAGCLTLLVGPNGAGKTSLIHRLAAVGEGLGKTTIGGTDLTLMPPAVRQRRLALLPASREIAWPLVARDLVALGLGGGQQPEVVEGTLASLDALQFADRRMDHLSTGERARVLLARALVARPDVLLLDEPAAHLDPARQIALLERLRLEAARGAAVLASIHDLALARNFADRILVMTGGRIIADGTPETALAPDLLRSVFGVAWRPGSGWVLA